jgi:hypothetical protein
MEGNFTPQEIQERIQQGFYLYVDPAGQLCINDCLGKCVVTGIAQAEKSQYIFFTGGDQ